MKVLILLAGVFFHFIGISNAQESISLRRYLVRYDKGDSSVTLIGKSIYENTRKMFDIEYLEKATDSCVASYAYDEHGAIIKEKTVCSDGKTMKALNYKITYDKNGQPIWKESIQYHPFFESFRTKYCKDSIIEWQFSDSLDFIQDVPSEKYIQIIDRKCRVSEQIQLNKKGDTTQINVYIYLSLTDSPGVKAFLQKRLLAVRKSKICLLTTWINTAGSC